MWQYYHDINTKSNWPSPLDANGCLSILVQQLVNFSGNSREGRQLGGVLDALGTWAPLALLGGVSNLVVNQKLADDLKTYQEIEKTVEDELQDQLNVVNRVKSDIEMLNIALQSRCESLIVLDFSLLS